MSSAPSMSVSVECLSLCTLSKGDTSARHDCSVLSCAWKVPRVLTGSLASTPWPQCFSRRQGSQSYKSAWFGGLSTSTWRCEDHISKKLSHKQTFDIVISKKCIRSFETLISIRNWRMLCSCSESSHEILPDSLWEDLKPAISYLAPEELNLVNDALRIPHLVGAAGL